MNWSRAKTILIVLLFAVDLFLLGIYVMREAEVRRDELDVREGVCVVLSRLEISAQPEAIPLDSVKIYPAMVRSLRDTERVARRLLGEVEETTDALGLVYTGNGGTFMVRGDSFSFMLEAEAEVGDFSSAEKLALKVAKKLGISASSGDVEIEEAEGGFSVKVSQLLSGVEVFDCGVEMKISRSGSIIASGKYIAEGNISRISGDVQNISALMISFADIVKSENIGTLKVIKAEHGYTTKKLADETITLMPVLEIITDKGIFYIDMASGKKIAL